MEYNQHVCTGTHNACVSIVPIFNHLEQEQMDEIMVAARSVSYKKGEIIYQAGDQSNALYIVNKGKIKIYRLSESGKEQLLRILTPGEFTGELALFNEGVHEAFAEAMADTQVCMIRRADLQALLLKFPSISLKILTEFSKRLEQSEKQTARFATEKVETRLALFLAECLDPDSREVEFTLPMSKKDLASYLGTTPETISRKLSDFEAAGLIKQKPHKKIEIIDLDELLLF
ncbi:Crp/Fnr family transcriptional regulator [Neobacillus citreus]|uniref:Crp/Fnr family transcriptional regulator n=1 Tax=Neobacillus citreus TaxID=2833578 RepID=A0A942T4I6_9BACI|nr:Crp/Fnr family transcriptional regulator [Neobacillus citreus]MCH6267544.1 Crp/Fnr family transcriptional regulator [Neobacillus citreus]